MSAPIFDLAVEVARANADYFPRSDRFTSDERCEALRVVLEYALQPSGQGPEMRFRLLRPHYQQIGGVPLFCKLLAAAEDCEGAFRDSPEWGAAQGLIRGIVTAQQIVLQAEADAQAAVRCGV